MMAHAFLPHMSASTARIGQKILLIDLAPMATAARIPLLTKPQSVVTLSDFTFKGLST